MQVFLLTRSPNSQNRFGAQVHLRDPVLELQVQVLVLSLHQQNPAATSLFGGHFSFKWRHLQTFFPDLSLEQTMNENLPWQKHLDLFGYDSNLLQAGTFWQEQVSPLQTLRIVFPLHLQNAAFGKEPRTMQNGSFLMHIQKTPFAPFGANFAEQRS